MTDTDRLPEPNQEMWPFGPAPKRECGGGGDHDWRVINLFHACDPPAPSFQCEKCGYRWSRKWTQPEFDRFLAKCDPASRAHYAVCRYEAEPPYAT